MKLRRLDSELVRRKLVRSRNQGAQLIAQGQVTVDKQVILKPASQVDPASAIEILTQVQDEYVSRGAYKLAGALDALGSKGPKVLGKRCLDAGASTGGFTDVLLRRGAKSVVAVDVGYGQLAWKLQSDERVEVLDRTNVRYLKPEQVAPAPDLVVGDMSFISLTLVIPALVECASETAQFLLMVKPQFEVGKSLLGKGGVVRDPQLHEQTVLKVAQCAQENGLGIVAVQASPLPGPSGNVEYFLFMEKGRESIQNVPKAVEEAVANGPAKVTCK